MIDVRAGEGGAPPPPPPSSSPRLGFAVRRGRQSRRGRFPPPLEPPGASLEPVRASLHGSVAAGGGGARRSAACPRLPSGLWVAPQGWAGCGAGWGPAALRGGRPFPLTGVGPIAASEVEGPGPCLWALWTGGTLSVSLAFTDCKVLFIELPYLP